MAKTISNLNKSQKEIINDEMDERNVVSSSELIEDVDFNLSENIIDRIEALEQGVAGSEELLTNDKTIIGAINELFQNANNGKELIANAIGKPISKNDTFSAMSNEINGLLSTFKTNMMNNGVTVESTDKFKTLIDKIATMVEEGGGKGIQFAEGTIDIPAVIDHDNWSSVTSSTLDFTPSYVFCHIPGQAFYYDGVDTVGLPIKELVVSNLAYFDFKHSSYSYGAWIRLTLNKNNTFTIKTKFSNTKFTPYTNPLVGNWYAIGVGEEDTTLRDSLASILGGNGVDVSNEDDMSSLISKVDERLSTTANCPAWYNPFDRWLPESTVKFNVYPNNGINAVLVGNNIYSLANGSYCVYNIETNTCSNSTSYTNLPSSSELSRGDFSTVVLNNLIYFVGGLKSYSTDRQNANNYLMVFNPSNNSWSTKANMITALNQAAVCTYNNLIYVFGGRTYKEYYSGNYNYGYSTKCSYYNPTTNTWTSITDLPKYKSTGVVKVVGKNAYIVGTGGDTMERFKYDFSTGTYTTFTTGLTRSSGHVVYKDRIYEICATYNSMYDTITGTVTDKRACTVDKNSSVCIAVDDLIYNICGTTKNSNGYYNSTYYYGEIYIPEK